MNSNKLSDLHDMGIKYWDEWDIGDGTIGKRYGATVGSRDLMTKLLNELISDPFGRRHILSMWQVDDFSNETGGTTDGLNPCCYETIWTVRKVNETMYLDMALIQRSSDYFVSNAINEVQYQALQMMVASHCGYKPGKFTHFTANAHVYDRHMFQATTICNRLDSDVFTPQFGPLPYIRIKPESTGKKFNDFTINDFEAMHYDKKFIDKNFPQVQFEMAI